MTAFRWHRAPDWTPEAHEAADRYERGVEMLTSPASHAGLQMAVDIFRVAQEKFAEAMFALDKQRRPEFYAQAATAARTSTSPCPDCDERPSAKGGLYAAALDRCYAGRCGRNVDAGNPSSKMHDHVDKN